MASFNRIILLLMLLSSGMLSVHGQNVSLSGRVVDAEGGDGLAKATVQLYVLSNRKGGGVDTTFVSGTFTDTQGQFALSDVKPGAFLMRLSYLGYKTLERSVTVTRGRTQALGTIKMEADAVLLSEAVVTANLPKMVIKDDTVVYNADAFRVPEGSVIEALVEVLPGAKIDDDGKISINGKDVRRFKLDGRDFMTGNNDAVMKNLPSYVIDQVKAYDEKSDLSRLTGVDDGNDDFVLEFTTKRSARNGLQANPDIGYGTDGRYGIRLTAMKPFGAMRYTFMGNANNVNDRNFSGRGGRGRGNNQGQREAKTAALDISYENNKDLKLSGRVTWSRQDADNWNRTGSENYVNTRSGAFSNSVSQSYSRNNNWTGNMNLQWTIDSMTTLSWRPDINFSTSDSRSYSTSASFNANPFDYTEDPLLFVKNGTRAETEEDKTVEDIIVNGRQNKSLGDGDNKSLSSQLQLYRRFGRNGRNVAVSSNINYRDGNNQNGNLSLVHLYQTKDRFGNDSTYQTNRYTSSGNDNFSFSLGATYTEPLYIFPRKVTPEDTLQQRGRGPFGRGRNGGGRRMVGQEGIFLQVNYRYSYSHQKNDPATYDFPDFNDEAFASMLNEYHEWGSLFGYLDNPLEMYLSDRLSRYSERTENGHNIDVQLRLNREKYNMNLGVSVQPQKSHYIQQYLGVPVDTVRTVTNISPTLNLRYRFTQYSNLQVQMRGQTQQPNITQLLEIYDDTNPLNINIGNPGLKPSFTYNLSANYQQQRKPTFVEDSLGFQVPKNQRHWSYSANVNWSRTSNSIGNIVTYDEETGGRTTRPENINGNWNTRAGVSFNIGLDTLNRWDFSGGIDGNYSHHIGYVNLNRTAIPDRNVTHSYNVAPNVSLSFRNKWLNVSLNGRATYARTENELQSSRNQTTWNFNYGGNTRITFPWGSNLSTDFHVYSKRGYTDATLNTNELIWNAQLSHSFLRGKKMTVMLQWYDILHEQTNFNRTVNANGWRDQEVNAITSYAMLHVSYRLNFFGGRNGGERGGNRGDWDRETFGRGRPDGGGGRGGRGGFGGGGFGGGGGWGGGRP
ncbi:MAG: TonB-dependent receptor [Prevotella sp.]|nr:TonB-dependent receptor [Prevotella sp.]